MPSCIEITPFKAASCNWSTTTAVISQYQWCMLPCWPLLSHLTREFFANLSCVTVTGFGRFQCKDDGKSTNKSTPLAQIYIKNSSHRFWLNFFLPVWDHRDFFFRSIFGTFHQLTEIPPDLPGANFTSVGLLELITMVLQMDAMPLLGGAQIIPTIVGVSLCFCGVFLLGLVGFLF